MPRRHGGGKEVPPGHFKAAQPRPGTMPRRHLLGNGCLRLPRDRSTKAGDHAPATPLCPAPAQAARQRSLNQGRGPCPGDTRPGERPIDQRAGLRSTKAGDHAPATLFRLPWLCLSIRNRSTKAGDHAPATRDPAYTSYLERALLAQPRPGTMPRRHAQLQHDCLPRWLRSTKAGDHAPATLGDIGIAQLGQLRSTKAGDHAPATQDLELRSGLAVDSRSTKAGDHAPATPRRQVEGPDLAARSTKAGDHAPATRSPKPRNFASNFAQPRPGTMPRRHGRARDGRDSQAGAGHAQPRPGTMPRRHHPGGLPGRAHLPRSTKAGDHAPATPAPHGLLDRPARSLNQGRGPCPGDT